MNSLLELVSMSLVKGFFGSDESFYQQVLTAILVDDYSVINLNRIVDITKGE